MREAYLSWPEAAWLVMQYTICANYLALPQMLYHMAGRSGWVVPFIAIAPAMAGSWAVYRLHMAYPKHRVGQFLPQLAGRHLGVVIGLIYSLFWLSGAAINTMLFAHYISATILGFTPPAIHAIINSGLAVMVALYGLKTLVRFTDALFLPIVVFLIFSWISPFLEDKLDLSHLLPLRASELAADPVGLMIAATSMYHGYTVILIAGPAFNPPGRSALLAATVGTLLAVPGFVTFSAYPIAAFGWPLAGDFAYPAGSFLEVLAPGSQGFPVRRFDFILTMFFRFIMVIASITYFFSAAQTLSDLVSPKAEKIHPVLVLALGALIGFSFVVLPDLSSLLAFVRIWLALGAILTIVTIILAVRSYLATTRAGGDE